jgi:hypothetical protein
MFCGYCGRQNAEDYRFCVGCGKPLENDTPNHITKLENMTEDPTASPQDNQKAKSPEESVPQSEIKEHFEASAIRESMEPKILHADSKTMQAEPSVSFYKVMLLTFGGFFVAVGPMMLPASERKQRLWNAAEGVICGLIFAGLFWLLGAIIKSIMGKEIRTGTGYAVAVVLGFLFRHLMIAVLTG